MLPLILQILNKLKIRFDFPATPVTFNAFDFCVIQLGKIYFLVETCLTLKREKICLVTYHLDYHQKGGHESDKRKLILNFAASGNLPHDMWLPPGHV